MKNFIFLSIILIFTFFVVLLQLGGQKAESNTKIEEENRAKIIKNPVESRHGEFELDLEKDLVIGSDNDENYFLYSFRH